MALTPLATLMVQAHEGHAHTVMGTKTLSLSDLKPGQRVVVSARMEGDKMIAATVKVGAAGKTTPAAGKPAAPHH